MPLEQKQESVGSVVSKVREKIDLEDPQIIAALKVWQTDTERIRGIYSSSEVFHGFSAKVIEKTIDYFAADIVARSCVNKSQISQQKRDLAKMAVAASLSEIDDIYPDDDLEAVPEMFAVIRHLPRGVTRRMLIGCSHDLANSQKPAAQWPPHFEDFRNDLESLVKNEGAVGREKIKRICADPKMAREIFEDEAYPDVLRFLAKIVTEESDSKSLPEKPSTISGFAVRAPKDS